MKDILKDEYDNFIESFSGDLKSSAIRINTAKKDAENIIKSQFGELENVPWCPEGFYVERDKISGNHPYHLSGLFYFQEASAMSAVSGLPINPGDFVLDLCAAPGGKSTHAAQKLNNSGLLVANEINSKRASILSENIERMGFSNVIVTNESPLKLSEKYIEFFDKIIVDAPCSGEGMFRKEPQAITEWSVAHTLSCAERQKNILDSAVKMLKPGGYIMYSTCTFAPCENEENIKYILEKYPHFKLMEIPELSMLKDGLIPKTKRIYPHHNRGEGHFAALLFDTRTKAFESKHFSKSTLSKNDYSLLKEFFDKFLNIPMPNGNLISFGEQVYALPDGIDIDKIKVLRAGLHLGTCKKGRFEPSHALALANKKDAFSNTLDFKPDSPDLFAYLHGNTIPCNMTGWVCVTVSGIPIGWGKASGGILKNHYPKKLRLLG